MAKTKVFNRMRQSDYWLGINMKLMIWTIMFSSINLNGSSRVQGISFDHSIDLNDDYRVLWNVVCQEITFEIQVRTLGYVGFGFSRDGRLPGSDIAIGWVSQGKVHFQVSSVHRISILHFIYLFGYLLEGMDFKRTITCFSLIVQKKSFSTSIKFISHKMFENLYEALFKSQTI